MINATVSYAGLTPLAPVVAFCAAIVSSFMPIQSIDINLLPMISRLLVKHQRKVLIINRAGSNLADFSERIQCYFCKSNSCMHLPCSVKLSITCMLQNAFRNLAWLMVDLSVLGGLYTALIGLAIWQLVQMNCDPFILRWCSNSPYPTNKTSDRLTSRPSHVCLKRGTRSRQIK
jgi:hypothetical protein